MESSVLLNTMEIENTLKPLVKLIQDGQLCQIKKQLKEVGMKPRIHAHLGKSGDTVLHYAARHGHIDIVRFFVEEMDMDIELYNSDYKRPLHEAASTSHEQCVKYLINRGAKIDCLKKADWWVFVYCNK